VRRKRTVDRRNVIHAILKGVRKLKKLAYVFVAASLVFAAQGASADDTQFEIGGGRYQGVSAIPFVTIGAVEAPMAAPRRLESTHAGSMNTQDAPAPYNVPGGYFN
jgi:hypothetical protein